MDKARQRERVRSAASANRVLRFIDDDPAAGSRQDDCGRKAVRTGANHNCIRIGHVFAITPIGL